MSVGTTVTNFSSYYNFNEVVSKVITFLWRQLLLQPSVRDGTITECLDLSRLFITFCITRGFNNW